MIDFSSQQMHCILWAVGISHMTKNKSSVIIIFSRIELCSLSVFMVQLQLCY